MTDQNKNIEKEYMHMMDFNDVQDGFGNTISSVPVRNWPWDKDAVALAKPGWKKTQKALHDWMDEVDIPGGAIIDEVAIMFDTYAEDAMHAYIKEAVANPEVKMFNSAVDHVSTLPIRSQYSVEYNFLEVEMLSMRMEVMRIIRGRSPLHDHLSNDMAGPRLVHFSFKVSEDEYPYVLESLGNGGAVLVQSCTSTYGEFSYWEVPKFPGFYLKPRVNLRDKEGDRGEFGMPGLGAKYMGLMR